MQETKNLHWIIVAVVALALVVGFILPRHLVHAPAAVGQPELAATVPAQLLSTDSSSGALSASASPVPQPTRIDVYVCGDVRRPGVYTLSSSQRVIDGIARAGGALPDADLEQLNLAQPLSDAMKIAVPKKGEHLALTSSDTGFADYNTRRPSHRGSRSSHKLQPGQTLNINTASESELTSLPGVGPGLARRIIEYRTANGPFQSVDDLQNVSGIGPSKFDRMAPFIRL